jgi:hypothetical protein
VVWTAKGSAGTRLVFARSDDGGRSFGPESSVPGSDAGGNRGWHAVTVLPNGEVLTAWLDHRDVPRSTAPMSGHQHGAASPEHGDSVARAQLSRIFFASLGNRRGAQVIASGVCYCCKTSLVTAPDGSVYAAWRHVYTGNVRDIAFAKSSDGGRTFDKPARVSEDNWVLDGCPENGPALTADAGNAVHAVWPTLIQESKAAEPAMALFYAMSRDGQRFTTRQRIPAIGVPRHVQIATMRGGNLIAAWDEQAPGVRRVAFARARIDGANPVRFTRESVADAAATYPVLASVSDGAIIVWTSGAPGKTVLRVQAVR